MHRSSSSKASNIPVPGVLKARNRETLSSVSRESQDSKGKFKRDSSSMKKPSASQNVKRSRGSGGFNRVSLASKGTPSKFFTPAKSGLPSVSKVVSRNSTDTIRSSLGCKGSSKTWPLGEASFRTNCIDRILNFLINNNFDHQMSRNMLRTPTKNEFINIFNFIYKHIDPSFHLPSRFEDEICQLMKTLLYPVRLTKSMFLNVGSPHSWPNVLAMLAWLVDVVVNFYDTSDARSLAFMKDFDDGIDLQEIKFMTLTEINCCTTEKEKEMLILKYKDTLNEAYNLSEEDLEELCSKERELASFLKEIESIEEVINAPKRQHQELVNDNEKLIKYNQELIQYIKVKDKERVEVDSKLEETKEKYDQIVEEIRNLEAIKKDQAYDAVTFKRLKNRHTEIECQMDELRNEEKVLREQGFALEMEIPKVRKALGDSVLEFNTICTRLQMDGCHLSTANLGAAAEHWEGEVLPHIRNEKKRLKGEVLESHNTLLQLKRAKEKVKETVRDEKDKHHKLECKKKRLEEEIQFMKEEAAEEVKVLLKEFELLEAKVSLTRQQPKTNLYEKQRQLQEAKEELTAWKVKDKEIRDKCRKSFAERGHLVRKTFETKNKLLRDSYNKVCKTVAKRVAELTEELKSFSMDRPNGDGAI